MSENYGEFTPERLALLACARAWVEETPDAARMETVSRVAAEIRAAEERGRRRGIEEALAFVDGSFSYSLSVYAKQKLMDFLRSLAPRDSGEKP